MRVFAKECMRSEHPEGELSCRISVEVLQVITWSLVRVLGSDYVQAATTTINIHYRMGCEAIRAYKS